MPQITLDLPEELAQRLAQVAAEQQRSPEQVAIETLDSALQDAATDLKRRYDEFVRTSGLFVQVSEEEKRKYPPVPEEELKEIAEKLGKAGPLSELIIEERKSR